MLLHTGLGYQMCSDTPEAVGSTRSGWIQMEADWNGGAQIFSDVANGFIPDVLVFTQKDSVIIRKCVVLVQSNFSESPRIRQTAPDI